MDIISAYREVGSYRGAAELCGTTHKTVRRVIEAHQSASRGEPPATRVERGRNYDSVAQLVTVKVNDTAGRISAKRLLPAARAAGYVGSDRNFRRLVADASARGLWARFHDLADNTVVLADRDGRRLARYEDVSRERRTGYAWYGDWPRELLDRDHPAWQARNARRTAR